MAWRKLSGGYGIKAYKHRCWYQQGKICYDKKSAVSAKNLRFREDKIRLREYWCPHCNFWHLTKQLINKFMEDANETPTEETTIDETIVTEETPVANPAPVEEAPVSEENPVA